jgi:hypothetical protein
VEREGAPTAVAEACFGAVLGLALWAGAGVFGHGAQIVSRSGG